MTRLHLRAPIGILDEHPEWSARLMAELQHRQLPFEKIDPSNHAFDPSEREPRYAVIVNRTSPSSHTRGHGNVLFYAEPLLDHYAARGVPVINGVGAWRFEKSKALQVSLFERLGVAYPRTIVLNHRDQVMKLARGLRFPILVKPNIGGSGTGIARFESLAALEAGLNVLDFGPDATALLQEYIEPVGGAIVRVEVLDRECLYAIRIVRQADRFNLCPADLCQTDGAPGPLAACPGTTTSALTITRVDAPRAVTETVCRISRAASIDVGGVEYLVGQTDGRVYFYDVNATSNFVANAQQVLGFDPFPRLVDFIVRVARRPGRAPQQGNVDARRGRDRRTR